MFDIGWPELMVIAILTVLIVGPKELPRVIRSVTGIVRKIRMMTSEFQSGLDEMARDADLHDIKKQMMDASTKDIEGEIEKAIDPAGDIKNSLDDMKNDLEKNKDKINNSGKDDQKKVSQESKAFDDIVNAKETGVPLASENPNSIAAPKETSLTKEVVEPPVETVEKKIAPKKATRAKKKAPSAKKETKA